MQIVVLDGFSVNPGDLDWSPLKKLGTVSVYDRTHPSMVAQRLRGADAVFVNKVRMTREVLRTARQLKFIGELATGYDNIDLAAARERGITVCNVPAYSTEAVAQLAIAMLLDLTQRAYRIDRLVHQGQWTASPDFCYCDKAPILLDGMTFGVIGTGRIGAAFCGERLSFSEVLSQSDVLSLHCPATADTVGMIRRETIGQMKDGAILINTARGSLVNESDVAEALQSGKLSAFAADVVSTEPIAKSNPLLDAPNCFLTSHYAWSPVPTRQKLIDVSAANLAAFLNGSPIHVVS